MEVMDRLPEPECVKLCHRLVDGLCGREPPCWGEYGATWSLEEWVRLRDSLTALFCRAVGSNAEDEVLAEMQKTCSRHSLAVLNVLRARQHEIRLALLSRTNCMSSAVLQDFDWSLKLALSSDKISSLNTPLLSLNLDVRENGALRPIAVEMNKEELSSLINSLEAANKVILQMK